jgi:hypothetical protein
MVALTISSGSEDRGWYVDGKASSAGCALALPNAKINKVIENAQILQKGGMTYSSVLVCTDNSTVNDQGFLNSWIEF